MNNKLFARIAAAAVGVSMLSTFVFADDTASLSADKSQLTLNTTAITSATGNDATQVTMMAYLVGANATIETAYADETTTPMVALEQVAKGDVATKLATINVLASKFTETLTQAIIKTGHNGTTGDGVKWLIGTVSTPEGNKITIMNGATAGELEVDSEGYVTLPTTADFGTIPSTTYGKNPVVLYSWVPVDDETSEKGADIVVKGTTEPVKVLASELTGKKLYAKFCTDIIAGDVDGNGSANTDDALKITGYAKKLGAAKKAAYNAANNAYTGATVELVDGTQYTIGNVDITAAVNTDDALKITGYAKKLGATKKAAYNTNNSAYVGETKTIVVK